MFERLVLPLKQKRGIRITTDYGEETGTKFRPHLYDFTNIDIILLEGIFIFKREFVRHFDLKVWIECAFETALARAVARKQEGLSPADTLTAYQTIYFPAERLHCKLDDPSGQADFIYSNE
jgi:uridine kinase